MTQKQVVPFLIGVAVGYWVVPRLVAQLNLARLGAGN